MYSGNCTPHASPVQDALPWEGEGKRLGQVFSILTIFD